MTLPRRNTSFNMGWGNTEAPVRARTEPPSPAGEPGPTVPGHLSRIIFTVVSSSPTRRRQKYTPEPTGVPPLARPFQTTA